MLKTIMTVLVLLTITSTAIGADTFEEYKAYFTQGELETTASKNINGSVNTNYEFNDPDANITKSDAASLMGTSVMIGAVSLAAFFLGDVTKIGTYLGRS